MQEAVDEVRTLPEHNTKGEVSVYNPRCIIDVPHCILYSGLLQTPGMIPPQMPTILPSLVCQEGINFFPILEHNNTVFSL